MAYPDYIRQRAVRLRTDRKMSIDEIAEHLALPRTTVYYWVRDLPLKRSPNWTVGQQRAAQATSEKHRLLREAAYAKGLAKYEQLEPLPTFRDFVALDIAEGDKRGRNRAVVANSDPRVIAVCVSWFRRLSAQSCQFSVQYHADQDLEVLCAFWATTVGVDPSAIRLQRSRTVIGCVAGRGGPSMASSRCGSTTRNPDAACRPGWTAFTQTGG
jgi:transposase-like protein